MTDVLDQPRIDTIICCEVCDERTIRIPGEIEWIDPRGIITARCADHA